MDAAARREYILNNLKIQSEPVSASSLAQSLGVSRQVIVGDIALLRAQGNDIIATARGYMMMPLRPSGRYVGKLACQHTFADTRKELSLIVEMGGEILDVVVEHHIYGEITGQLNIAAMKDVDDFIGKLERNEARLLLELTDGVHLHTISCADAAAFDSITAALDAHGFLYRGK